MLHKPRNVTHIWIKNICTQGKTDSSLVHWHKVSTNTTFTPIQT